MSTAKSVANEKAEQSAKAKPAKAPKQAASSEIYKLTLPNTFNREAIDSIRASLSQKTSAANISITATTVETISASALLMLLSAARTEPSRVYRRVKLSKDEPYDTEKTHPFLHG